MGRADIFDAGGEEDLDLTGFEPKPTERRKAPAPREQVKAVTEANHFPSRAPAKPSPSVQRRGRRTGRNIQLNIKITAETLDAFYRMSDEHGWVLGETLERALAALERELSAERDQNATAALK